LFKAFSLDSGKIIVVDRPDFNRLFLQISNNDLFRLNTAFFGKYLVFLLLHKRLVKTRPSTRHDWTYRLKNLKRMSIAVSNHAFLKKGTQVGC
jgi:hypothetical protein